jgi:hypothetical protein
VKLYPKSSEIEFKSMLDDTDIQKLLDVFATRVELREGLNDLATKHDINDLMNAIDAFATKANAYMQETIMMNGPSIIGIILIYSAIRLQN